ncbi:hypothetical protein BJY52DRAFT_1188324 [Lactarius psammicola]|nr:hypothetical protein BJY52DRAFT_1188324 [Lactarius psammicola]
MHSYKTLAVLALAVSAATPAFSAPVVDGQQQARANVDERASAVPSGAGSGVGSLLKTIGTNLAFGALPVALEKFLGGNNGDSSARRAPLADIEERAPGVANLVDDLLTSLKSSGSLGSVLKNGFIGGLASGAGAVAAGEVLNNTRREPSPLAPGTFSGIAKTLAGTLASLAAADGVKELFNRDDASPQDLLDALQLLGGQLDELD